MEYKIENSLEQKQVKLFKPLVEGVLKALQEIFNEGRKADKVIGGVLKSNPKWGARDRAFIAENTYEIVRNWRLIKFCSGIDCERVSEEKDFLTLISTWLILNHIDISNYQYLPALPISKVFEKLALAQSERKIKYSVPNWMDDLCSKELGESWEQELNAMHSQADVYLRVNTLKISKEKLKKLLDEKNIFSDEVEGVQNALKLKKRSNVFGLEEYKKGFFEVQDAGSQMIAEFLEVSNKHRVIDACAGAGGKSLHLATIMENKGKVISLDIEDFKLLELKKRAKRNGIDTIETRLIESKSIKRLKDSADRLLLDVPCSGLGVLKRNPDAKWKLKPEFIEEIKIVQAEILSEYSKMLKIGGKMVYATCSILRSENEDQVDNFLKLNKEFKLVQQKRVYPSKEGFDGFYMALIEKTQAQISE
jgi:16S rRNA (cytosine967-C5)-methyltransferase